MAGNVLAYNWQPSIEDRYYGRIRLGLSDAAIEEMAEDMRLWAGANANRQIARKSNWSMAFKSWMRREAAKHGKAQNGSGNATMAAFDRIIAGSEMGSGGGEGPLLDLTATGGGARETAGGTMAAREPAESWGLFSFGRKDP